MCELHEFTKRIGNPGVITLRKSLFLLTFGQILRLVPLPELVISSHICAAKRKNQPKMQHVDNLQRLDLARVTLSHPDVITAHKKVISSHVSVILTHNKAVFSLEKRLSKVLNYIKRLKRRYVGPGKAFDNFFESQSKPEAQSQWQSVQQNKIH